MATMTHTEEQRKAWHAGKQKSDENKHAWFRRVIIRDSNFRAANTPTAMKTGIRYKALD